MLTVYRACGEAWLPVRDWKKRILLLRSRSSSASFWSSLCCGAARAKNTPLPFFRGLGWLRTAYVEVVLVGLVVILKNMGRMCCTRSAGPPLFFR